LTGLSWDDFCPPYLNMCRAEADKIIRLYKEFGPEYFRVSESTRVSAETYRAIAPAVQDGAIHCDGEVIDLVPQNSEKVAAAVAQLRRQAIQKPPDPGKSFRTLDKRCAAILAELNSFAAGNAGDAQFRQLFERVWLGIEQIRETHQL